MKPIDIPTIARAIVNGDTTIIPNVFNLYDAIADYIADVYGDDVANKVMKVMTLER